MARSRRRTWLVTLVAALGLLLALTGANRAHGAAGHARNDSSTGASHGVIGTVDESMNRSINGTVTATHAIRTATNHSRELTAENPVRAANEDEFFALGTHERTHSLREMNGKVNTIRARRNQTSWDYTINKDVQRRLKLQSPNLPNILFILADDLGYGDTSVAPFSHSKSDKFPRYPECLPCCLGGILTPNLERMAKNGMTLTNFHVAAPVCSPSRVSILTGLYPWRLGALNAFELGQDMRQRNNYLPQVHNGVGVLREAGYYTYHSGKWHVGGMREEYRVARASRDECQVGGPNQIGFEEYVSALDGPESPRYTFLLKNILHSKGYRHRIKDDVPYPVLDDIINITASEVSTVLSDIQALDAITFIKYHQRHRSKQPWYAQVWFDAPHGPYELVSTGAAAYAHEYNQTMEELLRHTCPDGARLINDDDNYFKYKSMVTAMDRSIGMLLDALHEMKIDRNTLVIFTSDNGPEDRYGAGTPGLYREGKRSLLEGGIKVPAMAQMIGTIPAGTTSNIWLNAIDIFPTFFEASGIGKPSSMPLDGFSFWPVLKHALAAEHDSRFRTDKASRADDQKMRERLHYLHRNITDRVFLWYKDTEYYDEMSDRVGSAGLYQHIKLITSGYDGCIKYAYDLKHDPRERHNLLQSNALQNCAHSMLNIAADYNQSIKVFMSVLDTEVFTSHCANITHTTQDAALHTSSCIANYINHVAERLGIIMLKLKEFVAQGDYSRNMWDSEDFSNATCSIATYSQSAGIRYSILPVY